VRPKSKLAGAGGKQLWKFRARREGKARMELEYVQSWETEAKPAQETNFIVTITRSNLAK
jgi:predicted secreted protein